MQGVYLFAAIFGWVFVVFFVISGSGLDVDLDADADVDFDTVDDIGAGAGTPWLSAALAFLSFRNIVFFAAFFGIGGLLLTAVDASSVLAFALAVAVGGFAAWFNVELLSYVRRTSVDSSILDREVAGSAAEVVLPIGPERSGRIAVRVAGQRLYMVATPFNPKAADTYDVGDRVVIVEVENGAARVAPMESLGF